MLRHAPGDGNDGSRRFQRNRHRATTSNERRTGRLSRYQGALKRKRLEKARQGFRIWILKRYRGLVLFVSRCTIMCSSRESSAMFQIQPPIGVTTRPTVPVPFVLLWSLGS